MLNALNQVVALSHFFVFCTLSFLKLYYCSAVVDSEPFFCKVYCYFFGFYLHENDEVIAQPRSSIAPPAQRYSIVHIFQNESPQLQFKSTIRALGKIKSSFLIVQILEADHTDKEGVADRLIVISLTGLFIYLFIFVVEDKL